MRLRSLFCTLLASLPFLGQGIGAQPASALVYSSPSGLFSMPIPVRPELGGAIRDEVLFVHFHDSYTTSITVAAIEMDATFRWERSVMSRQEFLTSVFQKVVSPQLAARCPDTKVDSVLLLTKLNEGTLYVGTTHPGFSQFLQRTYLFGDADNRATGRIGTMVFTKGDFIFIVSSELGERATERSRHTMSDAEENKLLMSRLRNLIGSISVTLPAVQEVKH